MVKQWPRERGRQGELPVELHQGSRPLPGTGANAIGHELESGQSDEIRERLHIANLDRAVPDRDDARAFPIVKYFIDPFPRTADQFSERAL
jgi:hypothetical protein